MEKVCASEKLSLRKYGTARGPQKLPIVWMHALFAGRRRDGAFKKSRVDARRDAANETD
jgi:hypothetical protein